MKMKYNGIADAAARFVEKEQLKNRSLWKLTADQFANCPDDEDLGWRGEYWGKLMRGACETYLYTRDEELYEILTESVDQLLFLSGWGRQNFPHTAKKQNSRDGICGAGNMYLWG